MMNPYSWEVMDKENMGPAYPRLRCAGIRMEPGAVTPSQDWMVIPYRFRKEMEQ